MSLTGSGPDDLQRVGVPIADLLAGMYGAFGVLAALQERERTGRGQVVRTSLLAASSACTPSRARSGPSPARSARRQGNHHPSICPYGLFHTADGAVQISVGSEGLWQRFCAGFGLDPDTPGMATNPERVENQQAGHRAGRERVRAYTPPTNCWPSSTESACPPGRSARSRGLRVGADAVARPARRRRARHPGQHHAARPAAAVLRPGRHRDHPTRAHRTPGAGRRQRPVARG